MVGLHASGNGPSFEKLGWQPLAGGSGYRNGKLGFGVRSGWGVFEWGGRPCRFDTLRGQIGRPGLWKLTTRARHPVFEIPLKMLARAAPEPGELARLAGWPLGTAGGKVDPDWAPPEKAGVEAWLPAGALTLQCGSAVRQGELIHETRRLALSFPIVASIPRGLPSGRRAWLRALLADAQDRWRLVRIGLVTDSEARAEVDFTGAPHDVLEELVPIGLDALRFVVSSTVEQAEFLVDGADGCRAVEIGPSGPRPGTRRK